MLVCKTRTATGRKASRQGKGKEKAQSTATADLDEKSKEETEGNFKTRKTLRPSIWASSKAELLLVLPELSGSKCFNGITEGSSNLPMVMLDESTAQGICVDVRWFDGEDSEGSGETPSVRLTLARDFVCPVAEPGIPMDSVAYSAPSDPGPSSQPNVPLSAPPGTSFVLNPYGNGCGIPGPPLPMVLPHDDYDGMDLEYIDERAPQGGAVATFSVPPVNMSPVFLTPIVPYAPPVQAATTYQVQGFSQAPTYHPAIRFGQYNPITLSTPSTISIPSLPIQHLLPFQQDRIPFPDTAPVPIPIPALRIPFYDEKPSPPTPPEFKSELDTIIPPSPPPEVEILTSSWKLSLPLILIGSHETFKRHFWGPLALPPHSNGPGDSPEKVGLAAEHAYVFLGFFRVVKMGQRRVTLSDEERIDLRPGKVAGRVEWTFDVEWVPSYHGSKGSEELSRPWWAPDFVFGRPVGRERGSKKGFTWLEKHAQARLNLLPMQLVDGQEAGSSDEAMPKGWLCKACGKLNQKVMMRHRWCGSRVCRDNPLSRGYAVDLSSARDANQTPLALPINTCNRRTVDASVADWDDGMRTLKYRPMSISGRFGNAGERGGILQHVFTCNLVDLQTEATLLFESIQSEVCLMKSTGDSGPLFKSHVSNSYANKRDRYAFSCLSWSEAPQAVKDAKDLMTFMGKYGEEEALDIDHLTIIGWVSSGTRKTPMVLAAREHTVAMLCLGNDVVLTIVPRWEVSAPVPWSPQVQQSSHLSYPPFVPHAEMVNPTTLPPSMPVLPRVANFTPPKIRSTSGRTPRAIKPPNQMQLVDVAAASAIENHVQQVDAISENPPSGVVPAQITSGNSRSKPASKVKPKPTQASESMSVTLVHGDMLLFSGCDFEYSIKRMGTSILVIGSKEDSRASI
ncbi:hypothetical protein M378DRAFT_804744 [Amanita muscaria Koide BX008]|uniref:Uncharacterized protein n=1 Tax=Amanita muscaria (strain Koide BX008) TaxID=946122 RepID=A0A0C2X087_AMAMK|nr:hypothetical protein M378DRAFT_804744 [Amanita muscaria Koide BX008]